MNRTILAAALVAVLFVSPALARSYRVESGDTLSSIATRFGTSVSAIRAANSLSGNLILVGQVLDIPDGASAQPTFRDYVVAGGDTLTDIARRFNSTVDGIRAANALSGNLIVVGQRLRIPVGASSGGSATPPPSAAPSGSNFSAVGIPNHPANRKLPARSYTQADLEVLARIVKGECPAPTPWEGKVAVAAVVLNRVRHRRFPNTIPGVAHQRLQFSCYNSDVRNRLYWGSIPDFAWRAARTALEGYDPTGGCTHYFNPYLVAPSWKNQLRKVRRIENTGSSGLRRMTGHDFYGYRNNLTWTPGIVGALSGN